MIPNTYGQKVNHRLPLVDMQCVVYYIYVHDIDRVNEVIRGIVRHGASQYGDFYFHHGCDFQTSKHDVLAVDCLYNFWEACNDYCRELASDGETWRDVFSVRQVDTPHRMAWMIDFHSVDIFALPYATHELGTVNPSTVTMFSKMTPEDDIYLPDWVREEITKHKIKYYERRKQCN